MKLGLLADVRGDRPLLDTALGILAEESCDRIVCLGSTAEGGEDDEAVLAALQGCDALILPSPHDASEAVQALPPEVTLGGLTLAHALPEACIQDETLWSSAGPCPSPLQAGVYLGSRGTARRASGDLYESLSCEVDANGQATRRIFAFGGSHVLGEGAALLCPGSVALAASHRLGGAVMTFDEATSTVDSIRFNADGRIPVRRPRVLVLCEDFTPHLPDEETLAGVDLKVITSGEELVDAVNEHGPDLLLLDYHVAGEMTGLDAMIGLQVNGKLPFPCLSMAGDPASSGGLKAAGAVGALPFAYLKDAFTRLLKELGA